MYSTLSDFFLNQAKQTPDNIAITDSNIELTYQQAANHVKFLAQYLQHKGYGPQSIISIYSSKRYEIIIAFLAISSIGASCVQLDKSFPLPLLKNIIEDTQSDLILCDEVPDIKTTECFNYIDIISQYNSKDVENFKQTSIDPEKGFWLVYSSGTTGKNKGIAISHRAILSSYDIRETVKAYDENSSIGCNIYYLWEAFRPLIKGGRTNIIPDDILYDFKALSQYIKDKKINEILFTPSYLETLLSTSKDIAKEIFKNIDTCWLNGEVVSSWLQHNLEEFMSETNIYNLYSISECHDVATYKLHKNDKNLETDGIVPVGHVLPKVEAIVLDDNKQMVKNDDKGEVYIHAIGLANEYINRPDLNKERFIQAKDSPIGKRLYKTGDYGKLSKDGQLITIYGRCDYIIKLRGYTLSLPFIESVIKDKLDIMHCVVNKTGETRMSEYLVAYLEIPKDKQQDFCEKWQLKDNKPSKALLDKISPFLAHYMLPKNIVLLDEISLNRYSNKLDRNSLSLEDNTVYVEQEVKNIESLDDYKSLWANILGISKNDISSDSCFFDLGGSSLSTMLLISKLKELSFEVKITDFIAASQLNSSYNLLSKSSNDSEQDLSKLILDDVDNLFTDLKPKIQNLKQELNKSSKNILLTGVTGFLGSHTLKTLVTNKNIEAIYCLVRAKNQQQAETRLENILKKLNIEKSRKIVCLVGDISAKEFSWQSGKYIEYASKIDTVIHTAASVNLLLPYNALRSSNFIGTANIIDFCSTSKTKHLIHISTNGIFPLHLNKKFSENQNIEWLDSLQSGYSQTKWAAEKLIHNSVEKGLNATVLRLGNISPVSNNYINDSDTNWILIKEVNSQQKIPTDINLEMTPIDHISKIIEHLVLEKHADRYIYNTTNKNFLNAQILAKVSNYEIIPSKAWSKSITDNSAKYLASDHANIDASINLYDRSNYEMLMSEINIDYPEITENYINKIFLRRDDESTQG
ncbi:AMP-binding protein [Francisella sp. 19X1-34]|uniref:AMP-binding protein n=1 Tax=Francisella sp. 19X1-34 TaxID=3087177 RepID=UPI002E37A1AC|nr:AMP-binding protein [Francisella sp. 19X1-34]MED7788312.1 AMP-binding protein [Francisella sp. 19X1-34]